MNGPSHYAEAERLRGTARDMPLDSPAGAYFNTAAQVHATLALAAATIDALRLAELHSSHAPAFPPYSDRQAAWDEATS